MIQPVFGIPSHARSDKQVTLEYLKALCIPKDRIFMSTWDTELTDYQKWKGYVNRIIPTFEHNHGAGLNTLLDSIENKYVMLIDDDISTVSYLQNKKLVPITDGIIFEKFLNHAFTECLKRGAKMWGTYPVYNGYFMSNKVRDRALLTSAFCGVINEGMRYDTRFILKCDYDMCCRSLKKYGKTLRFENVAANAKRYSKGGCEEFRTGSIDNDMGLLLLKLHGDILKPNPKRDGEVLLK